MPPKTKFTQDKIVEAGLSILAVGGWEGLTPKSIAKQLGSSTMPIFSHFPTMESFRTAVMDRAWAMLVDYASRSYTGDAWVDQGVGYVLFARDHGRLFNCMHYGPPGQVRERRYQFWIAMSKNLDLHPFFKGMGAEMIGQIRHLRSLLTHGIAMAVSTGLTDLWSDEYLVKRMISLCSEVLVEGLSDRREEISDILKYIPLETRIKIIGETVKRPSDRAKISVLTKQKKEE